MYARIYSFLYTPSWAVSKLITIILIMVGGGGGEGVAVYTTVASCTCYKRSGVGWVCITVPIYIVEFIGIFGRVY